MRARQASGAIRRRKILIIEDHDDTRLLYRTYFSDVGYDVETAPCGNEGIASALRWGPDVILLDLAMPRLDGWDTAVLLRMYPSTAAMPILACTAVDDADALARAMSVGCNGVVRKPCQPEEIEKKVDDLLAGRPELVTG